MERRRHVRRPSAGPAFVYLGQGIPLVDCDVVDLSNGGARIAAKTTQMLPAHFLLFFTLDGSERRSCRVVWRDGPDLGIAFED